MITGTNKVMFLTNAHRLPLHLKIVSLGLKSGRTLLERLRKKGWT